MKQKLLRLEEHTIADIEALEIKMNKENYISFSAIVRRLLRIGLKHKSEL